MFYKMVRFVMLSHKLLLGLFLCLSGWGMAEEVPSWYEVQKKVTKTLIQEEKSLLQWQASLREKSEKTPEEVLTFFSLSLRAQKMDDALQAVEELAAFPKPASFMTENIAELGCFAIDCQNGRVLRELCERFPMEMAYFSIENERLFHDVSKVWSEEQKAQWFHERFLQTQRKEGKETPFSKNRSFFWARCWLGQLSSMGERLPALETMRKEAIASGDYDDLIWYLRCFGEFRNESDLAHNRQDWEWLKELPDWPLSTQNNGLASELQLLEAYPLAIAYYQKALEQNLTDEEVKTELALFSSAILSAETLKALYQARIYHALAECYQKLEKKSEAQKTMLRYREICKEFHLSPGAIFSGAIQAFTGQRVVEQEILQKEEKNENDPAYWLERAEYYQGRQETNREEEALRKGLELCPPNKIQTSITETVPHLVTTVDLTWYRTQFLRRLGTLLFRENQHEMATQLLLEEMRQFPYGPTGKEAARLFAFDFPQFILPDNDIFWNWLDSQKNWEFTEERLLWEMLKRLPPPKRPAAMERMEKMARKPEASATRCAILGWVENRMNEPQRSIALLKIARKQAQKESHEGIFQTASMTLFESYLDVADWQNAEKIFPDAALHLTIEEQPQWLRRVADCAEKEGFAEDAKRIWKRLKNVTLCWGE